MDNRIHEIDLTNQALTPRVLAQIATTLEIHGTVLIRNCAKPFVGPGGAAMTLGAMLQKGGFLDVIR